MIKNKKEVEEVEPKIEEAEETKEETKPLSERDKLWQEYVGNYKISNPVKYATKVATTYIDEFDGNKVKPKKNEFETPPLGFIGKVEVKAGKRVIT